MQDPKSLRSALLVIDMQVGLFHGPEAPFDGDGVLRRIKDAIRKAHDARVPVFAIRHVGLPISPDHPLARLLPALELDASVDTVIDNVRPNAFFETELLARLKMAAINHLVITGMKTHYCIDTTCRAAADLGFHVTLVADGHTCMDTPALSAQAIIAHHNATLAGPFAKLVHAADLCF